MNAYLLDTHILLWWLFDDKRLTNKIRDLIESPDNQIFVSIISVWEIIIKKSLNKLIAPDNLEEVLQNDNFDILPVDIKHVLYLENLPYEHSDPFDRLLISQCLSEDLIFITDDKIIRKYEVKCLEKL
jgi:PIN domain nuclease of toxin-antitoxin system